MADNASDRINPSLRPAVLGKRAQLGMVVKDLDDSARFWTDTAGVGPWVIVDVPRTGREFRFRGDLIDVDLRVAFTYVGETQLEIIQQVNDAWSPYREFLEGGNEGLHHLGFWPEDFDGTCEALEQSGFHELCSISLNGTKNVAYYEGPRQIGPYIEVAPMTDFRTKYMSAIERLSLNWDGSRPYRRFESREDFVASADYASTLTDR